MFTSVPKLRAFPNKMGGALLPAIEKQGRAQGETIVAQFIEAFLGNANPVREDADLDVVQDLLPGDLISSAIGATRVIGKRLFLRSAIDVAGEKGGAIR